MQLNDFDFELPHELIAQRPLETRSASRLMHLSRGSQAVGHHRFADLPEMLREGDLLVRNETRVLPARLLGSKESGGQVEVLLLRQLDSERRPWQRRHRRFRWRLRRLVLLRSYTLEEYSSAAGQHNSRLLLA